MTTAAASRCAAHPARPAVDRCPVCDRPRCGADASTFAGRGCATCIAAPGGAPTPTTAELLTRAGLAALAVAVVGGWVATQYVRSRGFSLIAPGLVGVASAWATAAAVGTAPGTRRIVLSVAAAGALFSAALAFRLTVGGQSPLHPAGRVVPPYIAALVGVLVWPVLFGPTGRRRDDD